MLVGLQLVDGAPDRRLLVGRILELEDGQRQSVDEHDQVGPPVLTAFDHGELVTHHPVVGVRVVEIDEAHAVARDAAVRGRVLDRHSIHEHAVKGAVLYRERR